MTSSSSSLSTAPRRSRSGNGLDASSTMGALANDRRITAIETMVQDAVGRGGKVATGGNRVGNKGYFFEPTVVTGVSKDARAMNEEPFSPLALISPFSKFDDAAEEANRLPFGLASYAFTKSAKTANAIGAAVEAGMMSINSFALALPRRRSAASRIPATVRKAAPRASTPTSTPGSLRRPGCKPVARKPRLRIKASSTDDAFLFAPGSPCYVAAGSMPLFLISSAARAEVRNLISRLAASTSSEPATTAAENVCTN